MVIKDNTLVLDMSVAAYHRVSIVLTAEGETNNLGSATSAFTAVICGFEKVSSKSGFSQIEVELEEDTYREYFTELKLTDMVYSSSSLCPIDETSF